MYANSLQYTNTHLAWQQRVKREMGNQERYKNKGYDVYYTPQKTGKMSQNTWLNQTSAAISNTNSSYPIPFTRMNQVQRDIKNMAGFISDGTCTNISDPNTMMN